MSVTMIQAQDPIVSISPDKHTLAIVDPMCFDGVNKESMIYYITFLTNTKGAPKNFKEYRITFNDGVVRYMTDYEFIGTPFQRFSGHLNNLTKRVDDKKVDGLLGRLK